MSPVSRPKKTRGKYGGVRSYTKRSIANRDARKRRRRWNEAHTWAQAKGSQAKHSARRWALLREALSARSAA